MRKRARAENLTISYRNKKITSVTDGFLCVCPFIDNEFRYNFVKPLGYRLMDPQLISPGRVLSLKLIREFLKIIAQGKTKKT